MADRPASRRQSDGEERGLDARRSDCGSASPRHLQCSSDTGTDSCKKEVQLACRLQPCGHRLHVPTEVHDTAGEMSERLCRSLHVRPLHPFQPAEAKVLGALPGRLDFSWRGLVAGEPWRERVEAGWTGDLALVFPSRPSALLSFGYLCGFLRCAQRHRS